jgi:hypothetical protein
MAAKQKKKTPKFDLSVWSEKQIDAAVEEALRAARNMSRRGLESHYAVQIGSFHCALNDRNREMARVAKLQKKLRAQYKVLKLLTASLHGARKAGWNDALEAVAKSFEKANWDMVTGESGAHQIRKLKR